MSIPVIFIAMALASATVTSGQIPGLEDMTKCPAKSEWMASLDSIEVENCPDMHKPCNLVKGQNYTITINFTPTEEIKTVATVVKGVIAGLAVDYQVPQPDACDQSGLECPLQPGQSVKYQTVLPVKPIYPSIRLKVRWALIDEEKRTLLCVMIPVRITTESQAAHH